MRLEYQNRDGICVLRPAGRFVTGSDAELLSARKYLDQNGFARAVIDFSAVPYVDSTGLAFVVELHKSLAARGGQLLLAGANERIREVLEITRFLDIIPLFDDVEEAVACFHSEVAC